MSVTTATHETGPPAGGFVPRLANGDHLTREEFERRDATMPELNKAELIEGVVYMPSPVNQLEHGGPHSDAVTALGVYRSATPGVILGDNSTVRLDSDNEPQPDALLMVDPKLGGQARIDPDGCISGAPEFVLEVAATSASYDLHDKLNAYRRNGVREYVVWRVLDDALDWHVLRDGRYVLVLPDESGLYKSEVLPGLRLHAEALIQRDLAKVLQELQKGIASPEHATFVERLQGSSARQA